MNQSEQIPDPPGARRRPPLNRVANLQPFFDALAARSTFEWSFLHDRYRDHAAWRRKMWPWVMDRLCWDPGPLDLRPEVISRETGDGYVMEKVVFSSHPLVRVPGYLLLPSGAPRPRSGYPGILALHDMGGLRTYGKEKLIQRPRESAGLTAHRQEYYDGHSVAIDLARRGYAVLSTDAFLFGERAYWPGGTPPFDAKAASNGGAPYPTDGDFEGFLRRRDSFSEAEDRAANAKIVSGRGTAEHHVHYLGGTMAGLTVWDDMRSIDYLAGRPEVDGNRIGCVGLSFGAYRANYLAALEKRMRVAVSVCWMSTLGSIVGYNVGGAIGNFVIVPGMYPKLDLPDMVGLGVSCAFMAISGWKDALFQPEGMAEAHRKLARIYAKAGHPERFRSHFEDVPHQFNASMQTAAYEWLDRWLR